MKLFFFVFMVVFDLSLGAVWTYTGATGPLQWSVQYPICAGESQSPIDINEQNAIADATLGLFTISMFSVAPTAMTIRNNGHALQVDLTDGYTIDNTAILPRPYKAGQFHFHWGDGTGSNGGSEHLLDGARYFAEMHIVHYSTAFANIAAAADQPEGLAVLGFFVEVDGTVGNAAFNQILAPIVTTVTNENGQFTYDTPFSISSLLPSNLNRYYKYKGSLTTPPCYESVIWFVFQDKIRISQAQANILMTNLRDDHNEILTDNFRPVQAIGGRNITTPLVLSGSGVSQISNPTISTILCIVGYIVNKL